MKALIDFITKNNDDATEFFKLAFDYFGLRGCYETLYEDEQNEIVYAHVFALNTIAIWDYSTPRKQIAQLRKWTEKDVKGNDITICELTTINGRFYYEPTPNNVKKFKEDEARREKLYYNCCW